MGIRLLVIHTAVLTIVSQEGFEGATIRRVAAQAGCSAGAVQKRFPTRSQLLRSAFEAVVTTALERIEAAEAVGVGTFVERQQLAARETLPLDPARRSEGPVWTSYLLRAAVDESLSSITRQLDQAVQEALTDDLAQAQAAGLLRSATDPHLLSGALIGLVDGIAIRMLYTPTTEHESLLAALDAGIDALLPSADGGNSPFTRPD